jgi:hypothetical protein
VTSGASYRTGICFRQALNVRNFSTTGESVNALEKVPMWGGAPGTDGRLPATEPNAAEDEARGRHQAKFCCLPNKTSPIPSLPRPPAALQAFSVSGHRAGAVKWPFAARNTAVAPTALRRRF